MGELIIVERPKFILVPDAFSVRFEEEVFYAYETISQQNLIHFRDEDCLPMLEQFDEDADMRIFLENITSFDMFGDEDFEGFLATEETASVFYETVAENSTEFVHDTWIVLEHFKMVLATAGKVVNSPIREVW